MIKEVTKEIVSCFGIACRVNKELPIPIQRELVSAAMTSSRFIVIINGENFELGNHSAERYWLSQLGVSSFLVLVFSYVYEILIPQCVMFL